MVRVLVVACVALVGGLVGCLPRAERLKPAAVWDRLRGANPDAFTLRTTLVEAAAGDATLNRDLWATAGRPLRHEHSTLLGLNGLRVGTFSGGLPSEFDRLARGTSGTLDATDRSFTPGVPKVVPVNGPLGHLKYRERTDLTADPAEWDLTEAECGFAITVAPADHGEVKLTVEPRIQHGDKQMVLKPTSDGTAFAREDRKPRKGYPALAFDVTLGPKDFLVLGASTDPADTLGGGFFVATAGDRVRQRALVIQAFRKPDAAPSGPNPGVESGP
jgi:hypothetical protein